MEREEYKQLNSQLAKLGDVCAENGFRFRFAKDSYPIKIIISPDGSMDGQLSMLENPVRHNGAGSALEIVFADGDVYLNPKGGGLTMTKTLQNKLRGIAEKIYFLYLQCFFIEMHKIKDSEEPD